MIISRLSSGLGNEIFEFMAGYALAKKRNDSLQLDLSAAIDAPWGFQLDYFNIPNLPKILYRHDDMEDCSHASQTNIPEEVKGPAGQCYFHEGDGPFYPGLEQAQQLTGDPILLCGYFIEHRYWRAEWEEMRKMFVPRIKISFLDNFEKLVAGHDCVGIHIRRGDFLVVHFAYLPPPEYYRAAIAWYRHHLHDPLFFIFSDDMDYARQILGMDSRYYYVHPLGDGFGPFAEFLCLSKCKYKVLANDSTFGYLAHWLNESTNKKAIVCQRDFQTQTTSFGIGKLLRQLLKKVKLIKHEKPASFSIVFDKPMIEKWSLHYKVDNRNAITDYGQKVHMAMLMHDDATFLNKLDTIFLNVAELTEPTRTALAWRKMQAHAALGQVDLALDIAFPLWARMEHNAAFHALYAQLLADAGFAGEAAIEWSRSLALADKVKLSSACANMAKVFHDAPKSRFLVLSDNRCWASSRQVGIVRLAIALRRLGHSVTMLAKTGREPKENKEETTYIHKNPILVTRTGTMLGIFQARYEDIEDGQGIAAYVKNFAQWPNAVFVTDSQRICELLQQERNIRPVIAICHANGTCINEMPTTSDHACLPVVWEEPSGKMAVKMLHERWTYAHENRIPEKDIQAVFKISEWLCQYYSNSKGD